MFLENPYQELQRSSFTKKSFRSKKRVFGAVNKRRHSPRGGQLVRRSIEALLYGKWMG